MGHQPATVILVVTIIVVCSVFQRSATFVNAFHDDRHIVREQDSANAYGAPEIDTVEKDIILPKGVSRNFTCKSRQRIMWKAYASSYHWEPTHVDHLDFETEDPEKPYGSLLMLVEASAQHVGRYYCINIDSYDEDQEEGLDDRVAEYQASTVYVYVNDPEHPMVPIKTPVCRFNQYEDFVIPCKPTHPDIEVELLNDLDGNLVESIEYSNTYGFLLSFDKQEDGGSYYCQVKDKPDHHIHFAVSFNEHLAEYVPKSSNHSDIKEHVSFGQRIRLGCQDERIEPLNVTPVKETKHRETVRMTDDEKYRCLVQDMSKPQKYNNFSLHECDSGEDYVILRQENNLDEINVRANVNEITPPIHITIEYKSYPANITYYWVNDAGIKITEGFHGKYELSHNDTHVKLRINDPTVYDTDNYTFFIMAGNARKTYRMSMNVYAKPIVQMESKFGKPNEEISFMCRTIGYPRPDISFAFVPCLSKPWTNCSMPSSASMIWDAPGGTRETLIANARTYTITPTQAGVVYCKATNIEGSEVTQADLLISDLSDAITLVKERPNETITVGDHVTIVCSALVYNYTNDITFVHNDKKLQASDGVSNSYSPQLYAWQARLDIDHVTKSNEGLIYCRVKTMDNAVETRTFDVQVLDPVAPTLLSGNSNEILSVDLYDTLKLECNVSGTPDPKIVWFKNDEPVHPSENNNRLQLTKTTLILEHLKIDDLGKFECQAENKLGSIKKFWEVEQIAPAEGNSLFYISLGSLATLIVVFVLMSMFYCKKKKEVKTMRKTSVVNSMKIHLGHYGGDLALDKRKEKQNERGLLPEEIPMLDRNRLFFVADGYNSHSKTETVSPKPRERSSKHNPEQEHMNVKNHKQCEGTGRASLCDDEMAQVGVTQEAISNSDYIALSTVDEKRCN